MEELENNDIIIRAYRALQKELVTSVLSDNEKHAINLLIEKLIAYYDKRLSILKKKDINFNPTNEKAEILNGFMTDVLVDINTIIRGGIDVYYFISVINKRLNDKEIESIVKTKKK